MQPPPNTFVTMRLLLTLTTAHALLHSVKLGGPSPAAWFRDTLGIGTDGGDQEGLHTAKCFVLNKP